MTKSNGNSAILMKKLFKRNSAVKEMQVKIVKASGPKKAIFPCNDCKKRVDSV